MQIPIEVSAKHIHLSRKHLEELFGQEYELTPHKKLRQPGAFAARESVEFISKNGQECTLRVVGPLRDETQIELSRTDSFMLGIDPPVRESGNIKDTPGGILKGPQGRIELEEGVIIAKRHIHINPEKAESIGLEAGQEISVKAEGERSVTFHNTVVRVSDEYSFSMHIDTDEGNAAGMPRGGTGQILNPKS